MATTDASTNVASTGVGPFGKHVVELVPELIARGVAEE